MVLAAGISPTPVGAADAWETACPLNATEAAVAIKIGVAGTLVILIGNPGVLFKLGLNTKPINAGFDVSILNTDCVVCALAGRSVLNVINAPGRIPWVVTVLAKNISRPVAAVVPDAAVENAKLAAVAAG